MLEAEVNPATDIMGEMDPVKYLTLPMLLFRELVTLWDWVGYSALKKIFSNTLSFPTLCSKTRKH